MYLRSSTGNYGGLSSYHGLGEVSKVPLAHYTALVSSLTLAQSQAYKCAHEYKCDQARISVVQAHVSQAISWASSASTESPGIKNSVLSLLTGLDWSHWSRISYDLTNALNAAKAAERAKKTQNAQDIKRAQAASQAAVQTRSSANIAAQERAQAQVEARKVEAAKPASSDSGLFSFFKTTSPATPKPTPAPLRVPTPTKTESTGPTAAGFKNVATGIASILNPLAQAGTSIYASQQQADLERRRIQSGGVPSPMPMMMSQPTKSNTGLIVGVVGGVALLGILLVVVTKK